MASGIFGRLFGDADSSADQSKDKGWHAAEHRWGFPGHSRDQKSYDTGSQTTGQTWSDLDPAGKGQDRDAWWWMTRVDLLAPQPR